MVLCNHKSCGREHQIWLPTNDDNQESDVNLHPWCVKCGLVKNISDDKPHKIGYWTNILSRISLHFPLTKCQKRLVIKELESFECFNDMFGTTGSAQWRVFVKILQKYSDLRVNNYNSYIY